MASRYRCFLLIALALVLCVTRTHSQAAGPGIAVVELFTSQGCSSCPPADAVLRQLSERADKDRVLVLSFHVDYWNRLGWRDPYSSAQASDRQRAYATVFESSRVYTPQMIVGGVQQFAGSDVKKANDAIAEALQRPATCTIKLSKQLDDASMNIQYAVNGHRERDVLNLAIVQDVSPIEVTRGENAGRYLGHANVVRHFQVVELDESGSGSVSIKLPKELVRADSQLIAYVQDAKTFAISGAMALSL
ncbi:DUF1223 domain-containing protein [Stieleria varia]|uniref:DUF1223 domain-containing protein n=1 Tax=Stieleria varia TaxID=2528005 RepID=A0A5C6B9N3_9BACT|nr:DUF1223 domain-containing protein [Stieleria varia]TWU08029.1 hypothetical protein Pla52n_06070 [Stieleria varia]